MPPLLPWADSLKIPAQSPADHCAGAGGRCAGHRMRGSGGTGPAISHPREIALIGGLVLIGFVAIGWRVAFTATLVALMFGVGGYDTLATSQSGDRTRSYFGIYTIRSHRRYRHPHAGARHHAPRHRTHPAGAAADRDQLLRPQFRSRAGVRTREPDLYGAHPRRSAWSGLGAGTLSCYRKPGQNWQFFEIDPAIIRIARDSGPVQFLPRLRARRAHQPWATRGSSSSRRRRTRSTCSRSTPFRPTRSRCIC